MPESWATLGRSPSTHQPSPAAASMVKPGPSTTPCASGARTKPVFTHQAEERARCQKEGQASGPAEPAQVAEPHAQ